MVWVLAFLLCKHIKLLLGSTSPHIGSSLNIVNFCRKFKGKNPWKLLEKWTCKQTLPFTLCQVACVWLAKWSGKSCEWAQLYLCLTLLTTAMMSVCLRLSHFPEFPCPSFHSLLAALATYSILLWYFLSAVWSQLRVWFKTPICYHWGVFKSTVLSFYPKQPLF